MPLQKYKFRHAKPKRPASMRIYECHVGIATQELKVGTYKEFAQHIIPRIKKQGMQPALICLRGNHLSHHNFRIQHNSADGHHGTRLLRQFRLSSHKLLCSFQVRNQI